MDLLSKINPFLTSLIKPGDKVLIALSGGIDSVTLAYLLKEWAQDRQVTLAAAHLNHNLRGKEAQEDAEFVERLAQDWGIPCQVGSKNVKTVARDLRLSLQETARLCRYSFLDEAAQKEGARWIALGHTADDQVETFLLNLLRGAGTRGLRGMEPLLWGKVIRPLLSVWKKEIEAFARENKIPYREDSSNKTLKYQRNRIRLELLPLLEEQYSPGIKQIIWRTATILREDEHILNDLTRRHFLNALIEKNPEAGTLNLTHLQNLPSLLRKRVLAEAYREFKGDVRGLSSRHWDSMERLAFGSSSGKKIKLPGEISLTKEFDRLLFYREKISSPLTAVTINCPGETVIPSWGLKFKAEIRPIEECDMDKAGGFYALLDYDQMALPLTLRPWQPGDRFCPLGMKGEKKLQDFFTDAKVPRSRRDKIPVLTAGDHIAWVIGYRIDERLKVRPQTRRVLTVEMRPL